MVSNDSSLKLFLDSLCKPALRIQAFTEYARNHWTILIEEEYAAVQSSIRKRFKQISQFYACTGHLATLQNKTKYTLHYEIDEKILNYYKYCITRFLSGEARQHIIVAVRKGVECSTVMYHSQLVPICMGIIPVYYETLTNKNVSVNIHIISILLERIILVSNPKFSVT